MKVKLRIKPTVGLYVRLRGTRQGPTGNVRKIVEFGPVRTYYDSFGIRHCLQDIIGRKHEWIRTDQRHRTATYLATGTLLPAGVWRPSAISTHTTNDISKVSHVWSNNTWVPVVYDWNRKAFVVK